MLASRTFKVVLVTAGKAVGYPYTAAADKTITYAGTATEVTLQ
jgi:hypothetical protein